MLRRAKLVANIVGVAVAYFGASGSDPDDLQWQTAWTVTDRLPRLVRIDVKFADGDPRTWLRLQVPLLLTE